MRSGSSSKLPVNRVIYYMGFDGGAHRLVDIGEVVRYHNKCEMLDMHKGEIILPLGVAVRLGQQHNKRRNKVD